MDKYPASHLQRVCSNHMSDPKSTDILVLRSGEEGLSMAAYAEELKKLLPDTSVQLARTPQQERAYAERARIITGSTLEAEVLERAKQLRWFAGTTSGYNHLPLDELRSQGVVVTNASGIHSPGIAEQAIANILVFARNLHVGWRQQQGAEWRHYQADELQDSTVTIVGLGAIGTAVEKRIRGFDVETIGIRYTPSKGGPTDTVVGFDPADVHSAFAQSDYVVVAAPLSETTRGLIGEAEFETLPPNAVLINTARGGIVDTPALVRALQEEAIRGAALDVTDPEPLPPDHPLWSLDNVLITPHVGGSTPKHWSRLAAIIQKNVQHIEKTGTYEGLNNQVLSPE